MPPGETHLDFSLAENFGYFLPITLVVEELQGQMEPVFSHFLRQLRMIMEMLYLRGQFFVIPRFIE